MPYRDGGIPTKGDQVRHVGGKSGTVTWVQLNYPSFSGRDAVSVKFDDGSSVGVSVADEYTLVSSAHK